MLPDGSLTVETKFDKAIVSALKKIGLNLVAVPSEALHTLQYGVIAELGAREQHTLNVMREQKVNDA